MRMTWRLRNNLLLVLLVTAALAGSAVAAVNANLPAGTRLSVRVTEKLSSESSHVGDRFHGTLAAPVVANGRTLFSQGAEVTGQVAHVKSSGRLSSPGELTLVLRTVRSGGRTYNVSANPFVIKGESHTKSNVAKIGGTTALGAILGGIFGGGKGAAIGAASGAAAGTGVAAATGKKPAVVESEAVLVWTVGAPPAAAAPQVAQQPRQPDQDAYAGYPDQGPPPDQGPYVERRPRRYDEDDDDERGEDRDRRGYIYRADDGYGRGPEGFSDRERDVISDCMADSYRDLPPGLAKRDRLPPGLERQLQRNGTLPPGLQKRVRLLPDQCEQRLPRLPGGWVRVVLGARIMLLDPGQRIVDIFWLRVD
jgi:outer membrane lipoprotein SlyB